MKMQLLDYADEKQMSRDANALKRYCALLQCRVKKHDRFEDTFYVVLPEDAYASCQVMNALNAYGYLHNIASRISSEKVTVPLDQFLKGLSDIE